jgi:cardiolipin synthase
MNFSNFPLFTLLDVVLAVPVTVHVLLKKENERAAIAWIGLIWLAPFVGALAYYLFGINRIQRKANRLRKTRHAPLPDLAASQPQLTGVTGPVERLLRLGARVHPQPFLAGNRVEPLVNGEEAYPAMLEAIAAARQSVALSTYIFDLDRAGGRFVEALVHAQRSGAQVCVILDDVGSSRFLRCVDTPLEKAGVKVARFIPRRLGRLLRFVNLRNHRKILLVDGQTGFAGGMNIREGHLPDARPRRAIQDIHFRISGPVLDQMADVFEEDWEFSRGETVTLPRWNGARLPSNGDGTQARVIADGPDVDFEKLHWILCGALAAAERRVRIQTPYLLPDEIVSNALKLAALRGVDVEILVPERSDWRFMQWAMQANFGRLLAHGIQLYRVPPPFDHSKLFLVDDRWALVGSSNWDARSLRLNFEIDLECIDGALGARLAALFDGKKARSRPVAAAELAGRSLPAQLRDNFARLFSPFL